MPLRVYRTLAAIAVELDGRWFRLAETPWDTLFCQADPAGWIADSLKTAEPGPGPPRPDELLPPIGSQEVWAAGVTYYRSRSARMEESAAEGDFYDRVYSAPRPELFFKATAHRVAGPGRKVRIRSDSSWNVPEPELALCISPAGRIFGLTIGNDMSSRDIEGQNPLYLPQAKVYDGCCGLGPGILLADGPLDPSTVIRLDIDRDGSVAFAGETRLEQLKRRPEELVEYLYRDNSFPAGSILLTGTGIVPPNTFTLQSGDRIRITIEPIGVLENVVA
jgi:2-dehydro-3-deoxy-D-arabinonate dehydratase